MSKRIFLSPPWMNGSEQPLVTEAFASNYIAPCGPMVERFEREFAACIGSHFAVAVSSCTAALDLLFDYYHVGAGDVIITPSLTFIATIAPAVHRGATPLFLDVDPVTWTLDIGQLARAFEQPNHKIKAVVTVDLYGQCSDYDALLAICRQHGVPLIVDSAEALGALYKGRPAGRVEGCAGVYSFNGNKIITTSGGGMLVTDDAEQAAWVRKRATQAREDVVWYEHNVLGYNYRMSNILAAIGVGQLQGLQEAVQRKRAICKRYQNALPELAFMPESPYGMSTNWLTVALFDTVDPEHVRLALESQNIESRPVWKPLHLQPVFQPNAAHCPVSEDLFKRGLCLPSGCGLTEAEQDRVIQIIRSTLP